MLDTIGSVYDGTRTRRMRDRTLASENEVCLERARFFTQVYRETEGQSPALRQAKGLDRTLRKMTLRLDVDDRLAGCRTSKRRGPIMMPEYGWDRGLSGDKGVPGRILGRFDTIPNYAFTQEEEKEFREMEAYWQGKTMVDTIARRREELGLTEKAYDRPDIPFVYFSSEQGHVVLGTEKVVREGFGGLRDRALAGIEERGESAEEEKDFLEAVVICCEAAIAFGNRFAALAREKAAATSDPNHRDEFLAVAEMCEHVPEYPARTFREALQSIWLTQCIGSITGQHGFSPGRLDQYLYPFYAREVAAGDLARDEAMELVEEFFLKMNDPFQDVVIGGVDSQGMDASNDVSYLIIDAFERCHPVQNNLCVRVCNDTPREFLVRACEVFRTTSGIGFYNDDVVVPALIDRGTSPDDAWDYGVVGCVELSECGTANPNGASGGINLAGMIELALNNGHPRDARHNRGLGAPTGDPRGFKSFEEVMDAVKAQVVHTWERMVPFMNLKDACFKDTLPTPFLSAITDDCIARGRDFTDGGPRYNNSGVYIQGPATAFDSLMAIKTLVFDEKVFTMDEMVTLLETNFEGAEDKRMMLVNRGPKFGNDEDADEIACELFNFACDTINGTPRPPVGTYTVGALTAAAMVALGRFVGATPDGRKAGTGISNSLSPSNGAERKGLTAALRSMAKLDQRRMRNCVAYNPTIHPSCVEGEGTGKFADLLAAYFEMGGLQMQPNVVSIETLRDAQEHPEDYRSLTVKVSGFSALFTELHKSIQNDIMARTALKA